MGLGILGETPADHAKKIEHLERELKNVLDRLNRYGCFDNKRFG
jgi:hypothetical protein